MKFPLILIFITTGRSVSAEHYCSLSDINVKCKPHSSFSDHEASCYRCPEGCSPPCQEICSTFCLEETCHYMGGSLQCSLGCLDGLTGKFCQELCPHYENCKRCHQFESECCREGFAGPYCNRSLTTSSTPASTKGPSSTISKRYSTTSSGSTNRNIITDTSTKVLKTTMGLVYGYSEVTTVGIAEPRHESGISIGMIIMIVGIVGLVIGLALFGFKLTSCYLEKKRSDEKETYRTYDSIDKQLDASTSMA